MASLELELCTICQHADEDKNMFNLPCKHKHHQDCLKELVRPFCPVCKTDITDALVSLGISKDKIKNRVNNEDLRLYCGNLTNVPIECMDMTEYYMLAINSIKNAENAGDYVYVYRDIVLDMISNTSKNFLEISKIKHNNNKDGVFLYCIPVTEFILGCYDPQSPSFCQWTPYDEINENNMGMGVNKILTYANDLKKRIINFDTQFGVIIMFIDDTNEVIVEDEDEYVDDDEDEDDYKIYICPRLMSIDDKDKQEYVNKSVGGGYVSGIRKARISYEDILYSITRCITCRESDPEPNSSNREHIWSKNYLQKLKKKDKLKNKSK